jgi:hypothetical protein
MVRCPNLFQHSDQRMMAMTKRELGYLIAKDAKEAHGAESNTKIRHDAGNELEKS